ncbi:MAG: hypothetical protein H7Y30_07705, partial [Pyrinomonadaceae bacterium]|nr:hypothetical protein [Pyrinomonadaceae bacterium]
MVRSVFSYLHTRPMTTVIDQVPVNNTNVKGDKKKNTSQRPTFRERERRFFIVPDLLAVPGTINFRIIADDYYVIVPFDTNPASSELRRAYVQYVIDPIILRYNKDIAARRVQLKTLLDERTAAGGEVSPDVFIAVARSLIAATEVSMDQTVQLDARAREARRRIAAAQDTAARESITKEMQEQRAAITDEALARLAESYERGAVLAFYFAEQLKDIQASGFDLTNFFADMLATFDPIREGGRLTENADARKRALEARKLRQAQLAANTDEAETPEAARRAALIKSLTAVDDLLRVKNYSEAEVRLREMMKEYQGEPKIFLALGQAASLSAEDATDEAVQGERLGRALTHYRNAINASSPETEPALVSRAYAAMGRIFEFFDQPREALQAFEAAIKLGPVTGGAYDEAVKGKTRLGQQK